MSLTKVGDERNERIQSDTLSKGTRKKINFQFLV